ncbi:gephyrin-like molybdotransferase Glp [Magnetovibrio sp. PR-2]|uniref:molybdopterin molybdotransferase MoeA n=1 Tax=Magnetovibrio sp. PR-2 TaxID=3120356 RepID=UPI002FCE4695
MALIPVTEALNTVLSKMPEMCTEQVTLPDALGRVLAEDITARLTQPWADVCAMDAYAVRQDDVTTVPCELKVVGESAAGGSYDAEVKPGEAVRIFTGAPVPQGADTIIIQEDVERDGDTVKVLESAPAGKWIRRAGMDFAEGKVLIAAPKIMTARDLGLAAAANVPWVTVYRQPRVAIIATGNEVVMPGDPLADNQIISSNSVMLNAFVRALGGIALDLGIARDDEGSLTRLVQSASQADMLITIGGASVGDYDLVGKVLTNEGMDVCFTKVAMQPGKPVIFGTLNGTPVLGMPGNPVSVGASSTVYLRPCMRVMQGLPADEGPLETAKLAIDAPEGGARQEYMRATMEINTDGEKLVTPFSKQDSSLLANFAAADCLVIRAPHAPAAKAGERVEIIALNTGRISL